MSAQHNPILVDLGTLRTSVEERVNSGRYTSADEVIQAGIRALDREEKDINEWLTELAEASLADPRPSIPADEVLPLLFKELNIE